MVAARRFSKNGGSARRSHSKRNKKPKRDYKAEYARKKARAEKAGYKSVRDYQRAVRNLSQKYQISTRGRRNTTELLKKERRISGKKGTKARQLINEIKFQVYDAKAYTPIGYMTKYAKRIDGMLAKLKPGSRDYNDLKQLSDTLWGTSETYERTLKK
ncbi:MAG: hypothetical protein ACREHG_10250 [Candidatus Saccharimonadales bacterium]